jgi:DnaK suppressor protein
VVAPVPALAPRGLGLAKAPNTLGEMAAAAAAALAAPKRAHRHEKIDLKKIEKKLLTQRDELAEKLREADEATREGEAQVEPDEVDSAMNDLDSDTSRSVVAAREEQLKSINDALERIHQGKYGICIMCGEQIPAGRLLAQPCAIRCVPCREQYERSSSSLGGSEGSWSRYESFGTDDEETVEEVSEEP